MRISAKADYAIRAMTELAAADGTVKAETLANAQGIPLKFLLNILVELKRPGLVRSQRGSEGGYQLGRAASEVTLADVIRAVEGPLAQVGDFRPEELSYVGTAESLQVVWVAVRANLRAILESVTLANLVSGRLPASVRKAANVSDSWTSR
ncbi:MAG: RrF2 family transcriptional regulator [Acidimicrobiales bacterium]